MSKSYFNIFNKIKKIKIKNNPTIIIELEDIIIDINNNINLNLQIIYDYITKYNIKLIIISIIYGNIENISNIKKILNNYKIPYELIYFLKEGRIDIENYKIKSLENIISKKYNIISVICSNKYIYDKYTKNCIELDIYTLKDILYTIYEDEE